MSPTDEDREALIDELIARLRLEGAPNGAWLLELEQARRQLASIERRSGA